MLKRFFVIFLSALLYFGTAMRIFAESFTEEAVTYTEEENSEESIESLDGNEATTEDFKEDTLKDPQEDLLGELPEYTELESQKSMGGDISALTRDSETPTITAIADSEILSNPPRQTMALNGDISDALTFAVQYIFVTQTITYADGTTRSARVRVSWDYNGVDTRTSGDYEIIGEIPPASGCVFAEGVLQKIIVPVTVKEVTEPAVIVRFEDWLPYTDAYATLQGENPRLVASKIKKCAYRVSCYDAEDNLYNSLIQWDFDDLDIDTVGVYWIKGTFDPPENTVFAEGLVLPVPVVPISVQAPGKPDINCYCAGRGEFIFPWVSPPGELGAVKLWLSKDGGEWIQVTDGIHVQEDFLSIFSRVFTVGSSYRMQVDYDGGKTGILNFTYSESIALIINNYSGGDRDGGDGDGFNPPDGEQPGPGSDSGTKRYTGSKSGSRSRKPTERKNPTPTPTQEPMPSTPPATTPAPEPGTSPTITPTPEPIKPTPQPTTPTVSTATQESSGATQQTLEVTGTQTTAVKPQAPSENKYVIIESFGETVDVLSGARLQIMYETGGVRFSKQGVTVTLSDTALDALNIQDSDSFTVEIKRISDNAFAFFMEQNGVPLSYLQDTLIMLPYQPKDEKSALTLQNEQGELVCEGSFNKETGVASFTVNTTGSFTIAESEDTVPTVALFGNQLAAEPKVVQEATEPSSPQGTTKGISSTAATAGFVIVLTAGGGTVWLYLKRRWVR